MANLFNAREILAESYRNRLPRLRGVEPGGNWIDIRCLHLPFNEELSDACRFLPERCLLRAPGHAAEGVRLSPSAADLSGMETDHG